MATRSNLGPIISFVPTWAKTKNIWRVQKQLHTDSSGGSILVGPKTALDAISMLAMSVGIPSEARSSAEQPNRNLQNGIMTCI